MLPDKERASEMAEMKSTENQGKKTDFSSQHEHLQSMAQLINIISPSTSLIKVGILLAIRCEECCSIIKNHIHPGTNV